ncbi:OmpA family protein [Actinomadura darangshiensis]|uniref:OmpA family protein n=1 Tax=Actinomadura darangshiensis TaxID=705336 RepID=A0A4R5B5C3_9ACTN|nr:OmpA family protein [Actinomadura darangshiensis]TDD81021.1 OmpA family protein [Actinomadura darangshiensis]
MRRLVRTLAALVAAGLVLSACGGPTSDNAPGSASGGASGAASSGASGGAAPTATAAGPEPTSCPGGGQLIKAVDIPAVHSDPVHIPATTIGGQKVAAATVPGVDIPAQHVPAQCVEHKPAPGGCLGAITIPGTAIPAVTIPAVRVPGVKAPGIDVEPIERPAVSRQAVDRPAVTRGEVCQSKPSEEGQYVSSVYRASLYRSSLYRSSAYRSSVYRSRACNDKGECIPAVTVPGLSVPGVSVPGVSVPGASLKAYVAGPAEVIKGEESIAYNIKADVLFDFGKADIKPAAEAELTKLAESIGKDVPPGASIQVDGHTDAKGDTASNKTLSEHRARAIADWLATKGGIDRSRLKATGYGETKPAHPNTKPDGSDDPSGRAKNRRVVISAAR